MENFSINYRIKVLRKTLRYKQSEFGEKIGVKASAVGRMEQEGSSVTEQSIMLICKTFHVSREWLEFGTGEMLSPNGSSLFSEFVKEFQLTPVEQAIIKWFATLSTENRHKLLEFLRGFAAAIEEGHLLDEQKGSPDLIEKKDLQKSILTPDRKRA